MADALARAEKGGSLLQRLRLQTGTHPHPGAEMWAVGGGGGGEAEWMRLSQVIYSQTTGLPLCSFLPPKESL